METDTSAVLSLLCNCGCDGKEVSFFLSTVWCIIMMSLLLLLPPPPLLLMLPVFIFL